MNNVLSRENKASTENLLTIKENLEIIDSNKRRKKYLHVVDKLINTCNEPIQGKDLFPERFAGNDLSGFNKFMTDNDLPYRLLHTKPRLWGIDFLMREYAFFVLKTS